MAWSKEALDVSGCGGEIPVVVAAAVAPDGLAALIAGSLRQETPPPFSSSSFRGFLYAAADQFLDLDP